MTEHSIVPLGLNVYLWSDEDQRHFLFNVLYPVAKELRSRRLVDRFWFKAFDARGPHIFALFYTDDSRRKQIEEILRSRVAGYLKDHPSTYEPIPGEVEARHADCRGKALCPVDQEPGFGVNHSFRLFSQPPDGYPAHLTRDLASEARFWSHLEGLTLRVLELLGSGGLGLPAVQFVAAVDRVLDTPRGHEPSILAPEAIWRYHACTLLPKLRQRVAEAESVAAEEVLESLPDLVGARNMKVFGQIWSTVDLQAAFSDLEGLVSCCLAEDGRTAEQRRALLREMVHSTLIQLQQPVRSHIPLVLFAWHRRYLDRCQQGRRSLSGEVAHGPEVFG